MKEKCPYCGKVLGQQDIQRMSGFTTVEVVCPDAACIFNESLNEMLEDDYQDYLQDTWYNEETGEREYY